MMNCQPSGSVSTAAPSSSSAPVTQTTEKDKDSQWYFSAEQLADSPSRRHGLDSDTELSYRQMTAYLIQDMGQRLQVSQLCINTAIVYMHRFYAFHSFTQFHRNGIAAASLFLAAKVEEQPRKLEHVIKAANKCLSQPIPNTTDAYYTEQSLDLVFNENVLLQTLGFDVAIDHPHTHVVKTCYLVKANKDLTKTSYFLASNSLHLTSMCLQYRPTVVACFCIYLACKWSRWEIPQSTEGKHWFHYVDKSVTMDLLKQLTDEFIAIYEKSPARLKSKLNSIKALAQNALNHRNAGKDRKAANEDWKMADMMKMYHSSLPSNESSNQSIYDQSSMSPVSMMSTPLLPAPAPPQQPQPSSNQPPAQAPLRKPDSQSHSSQHRIHNQSGSGSHQHSKHSYHEGSNADHKYKQQSTSHGNSQLPYGNGATSSGASNRVREHSQSNSNNSSMSSMNASRAGMLSTSTSSNSRTSIGPMGTNVSQRQQAVPPPSQGEPNYHKQRDRSAALSSGNQMASSLPNASGGMPPHGSSHKLSKQDAMGRPISKDSSSMARQKMYNPIMPMGNAGTNANSSTSHLNMRDYAGNQMTTPMSGSHSSSKSSSSRSSILPNQRPYATSLLPNPNLSNYFSQQEATAALSSGKFDKILPPYDQTTPIPPYAKLPSTDNSHQQQQQQQLPPHSMPHSTQRTVSQTNSLVGNLGSMPGFETSTSASMDELAMQATHSGFTGSHSHGHSHISRMQQYPLGKGSSVTGESNDNNKFMPPLGAGSGSGGNAPKNNAAFYYMNLMCNPTTKESPKSHRERERERERDRSKVSPSKKEKSRNLESASQHHDAMFVNPSSVYDAKPQQSRKKGDFVNTFTSDVGLATSGSKRSHQTGSLGGGLSQEEEAARDAKIRKVEPPPSLPPSMATTHHEPKPVVVNGIETDPDLVRSLLKESLCSVSALIKPEPLPAPEDQPPAELFATAPEPIQPKYPQTQDTNLQSLQSLLPPPPAPQVSGAAHNPADAMTSSLAMAASGFGVVDALGAASTSSANIDKDKDKDKDKEKKKKKHKHKEKEKHKDKSKDREERKKHKKDKDRHRDRDSSKSRSELDHNDSSSSAVGGGDNVEPVKIKIKKATLDSSYITPAPTGFKIKIAKERIAGELHSAGSVGSNSSTMMATSSNQGASNLHQKTVQSYPTQPLKIKISKDKVHTYTDNSNYYHSGGAHSSNHGQPSTSTSVSTNAVPSRPIYSSLLPEMTQNYGFAGALGPPTTSSAHHSKKKDRDKDRDRKRSSSSSDMSGGSHRSSSTTAPPTSTAGVPPLTMASMQQHGHNVTAFPLNPGNHPMNLNSGSMMGVSGGIISGSGGGGTSNEKH